MIVLPSTRLASVATYYFSGKLEELRERREAGQSILNMGIGSPDLPPHPSVIESLQHEVARPDQHAYQSYRGIPDLREAWSAWYRRIYGVSLRPDRELLPLMGSKEGIMHLSMAFLQEGDLALVPDPGYPTYAAASRLAGASVVHYSLQAENDWQPDWSRLSETVDWKKVKLCWLNSPHMPTGSRAARETWQRWIELARRHEFLLVHDNPYGLILTEEPRSLLSEPGAMEVAVELNSLSKSHNLAGWRMGVLAGAATYLNEAARFKSNMDSGMFKPLQLAAVQALQLGQEWLDQLNAIYRERQQTGETWFERLGISFRPNQAGLFIWGKVPSEFENGYAFSDYLLEEAGVFMAPGGIFGPAGENYIRLSLCQPIDQIREGMQRTSKLSLCKI